VYVDNIIIFFILLELDLRVNMGVRRSTDLQEMKNGFVLQWILCDADVIKDYWDLLNWWHCALRKQWRNIATFLLYIMLFT